MIYFVSHDFNFGKNMKKHFSKGVFQWNLSHGFSGKSYFPASPKYWFMLISEKTTGFFWFIYFLFLILFCFVWFFIFIYLFIYLFVYLFFYLFIYLFYFLFFSFIIIIIIIIIIFFFFASKEGYPWGWHLKIVPVKYRAYEKLW